MKIVRVLPSGRVVLCSDTARVNRGEVYFFEQEYDYKIMPCVYFHIAANSRRFSPQETPRLIDKFGFAYHIENASLAERGATDARVYSTDRSIIAGAQFIFSEETWHNIWKYTFEFDATTVQVSQLDLTACYSALRTVIPWLTLNSGDWFLLSLLEASVRLSFPSRVRLLANDNLVLDELIRS
jgi:hypothetical protein